MITVVMASYLGDYRGSASDREAKFRRAVNSFLAQGIGKLVVVADGCQRTIDIINEYNHHSIMGILVEKQPLFSGIIRHIGISFATTDWICYLDTDDEFAPGHLQTLCNHLDNSVDWFYYDDILHNQIRQCWPAFTHIGTSCIVHKKKSPAVWPTGYGHDWGFIQQLGNNYKKIDGAGYIVHHIPGVLDK